MSSEVLYEYILECRGPVRPDGTWAYGRASIGSNIEDVWPDIFWNCIAVEAEGIYVWLDNDVDVTTLTWGWHKAFILPPSDD